MKYFLTFIFMLSLAARATTNELIVDGNSLNQQPNSTQNWPAIFILPANCGKTNISVSGNDAQQQIDLMTNALFPNLDLGCSNRVIHWMEIGNTIAHGGTSNDAANGVSNYSVLAKIHDPYCKIGIGTAYSRSDLLGSSNTARINANTIVRATYTLYADFLIDYDSDPRLDYSLHPENFAGDLIHPSAAGAQVLTNINMATILFWLTNVPPSSILNLPTAKFGTVHWGQ